MTKTNNTQQTSEKTEVVFLRTCHTAFEKSTLFKIVGTILSGVYFLLWKIWIFLYTARILPIIKVDPFIVSLGNLSVGGTGKTPLTLFLAQQYQARGKRVGIVSRGYRGCYKGPFAVVSDGQTLFESARVVGDEPVLMAKRLNGVPIVVSRDRSVGAKWLADHFQTEVILLDDGFQHLRLHRDVNLLLMDTTQANYALLPKGPMREPIEAARRADLILLTRGDSSLETFAIPDAARWTGPSLRTAFTPVALIHLQTEASRPVSELKNKRILAVCGIGNPNAFLKMLRQQDALICETFVLGDHFDYTVSTLRAICEKKAALGAEAIITTEKDAVKIAPLLTEPTEIWALRIDVDFLDPPQILERLLFK